MSKHRLKLAAWLITLLMALATLATGPAIQSDLGQFLPQEGENDSALLLDTLRDGPGSRLLLLDLSGADPVTLAAVAKQFANKLATTPFFLHILGAGTTLPAQEQALLFRYRYLLSPVALTEASLHAALQQRFRELVMGVPVDRAQLRADPTAQYRKLLERFNGANGPQRLNGVWFSTDQQHAMLLLHTAAPAFALDQQEQAIAAIHQAFAVLAQPQITLAMSGPPLFGIESRRLIRDESQQLTLVASIAVALLILLTFRSFAATLLVALPLLSGIVVGAAAVILLFDNLHGISLAFGITLIGLTVDYPLHLFSHGGREETAARLWPTLRLGMLTSVIGFSALLFSNFSGLAQMGLFAITGLITAALVSRWVLPALHPGGYRMHLPLPVSVTHSMGILPRWFTPLLLLLSLGMLLFHGESLWESRLTYLSPIPHESLERDRLLRQRLQAAEPGQLILLRGKNREELLQRSETLSQILDHARQSGWIGYFDTPTHYLPSTQQQLQYRNSLPDAQTLSINLAVARSDLPFQEALFQPFIDDISRSRELPPLTPDDLANTLTGMRLASLLREQHGQHYALFTLGDIRQIDDITRIAEEAGAQYIDLPQRAAHLVDQYRKEALQLMGLGMMAILLILALVLRNPGRVFQVSLPVFTAITTTTVLIYLLGEPISLFHLASLLLVLGIGLDYGLFADRCRQLNDDCHTTAIALLLCSSTTLLVFGLLALSAVPVLHAIGLTVSIGVVLTLLLTLGSGKKPTMV